MCPARRTKSKKRSVRRLWKLQIAKHYFKRGLSRAYSSHHNSNSSIDHDDLKVAQLRIGTTPSKELREVSLVVLKAEPFQLVEG